MCCIVSVWVRELGTGTRSSGTSGSPALQSICLRFNGLTVDCQTGEVFASRLFADHQPPNLQGVSYPPFSVAFQKSGVAMLTVTVTTAAPQFLTARAPAVLLIVLFAVHFLRKNKQQQQGVPLSKSTSYWLSTWKSKQTWTQTKPTVLSLCPPPRW